MHARYAPLSLLCGIIVACLLFPIPATYAFSYFTPLALFVDGPIRMDLRLGAASETLLDGNTSWDAVIEGAGAEWNSHMNLVQFTRYATSPKAPAPHDGVNQIYWDDSVNGLPFDPYTLAVATRWIRSNVCTEADIVFDVNKAWNSYRGPLQPAPGGGTLHDIYRIGLHELGHALGLNHPDEAGQSVDAIMNSSESDVDDATADDIAGVQSLYYGLPPSIDQQPVSQTVLIGTSAQFTVQASGAPAPAYQWYRNNVLIPGATNSMLNIADAAQSDAGTFRVRVKNVHGTAWSDSVTLTVLVPPVIVTPPVSRAVRAGTRVTFSATVTGTRPLTYLWSHNGNVISNATGSSYSFIPTLASDGGEYAVTVMNSAGASTSSPAQLTVLFLPEIAIGGGNIAVLQGSNIVLSASTTGGTPPFTYQWLFRGRRMAGATTEQLVLTNIAKSSAGTYVLEARNAAGTRRSAAIKVTVIIPPTITVQPKALALHIGARAVFRVSATGTKPLLYQWLKEGSPITNAIKRSFVIPQVQSSDAANYSVRISNVGGTVESIPVALTVD